MRSTKSKVVSIRQKNVTKVPFRQAKKGVLMIQQLSPISDGLLKRSIKTAGALVLARPYLLLPSHTRSTHLRAEDITTSTQAHRYKSVLISKKFSLQVLVSERNTSSSHHHAIHLYTSAWTDNALRFDLRSTVASQLTSSPSSTSQSSGLYQARLPLYVWLLATKENPRTNINSSSCQCRSPLCIRPVYALHKRSYLIRLTISHWYLIYSKKKGFSSNSTGIIGHLEHFTSHEQTNKQW